MADARIAQAGVELVSQDTTVAARIAQAGVELIVSTNLVATTTRVSIQVQLSSGVWTDVSADTLAQSDVKYGIDGNGPADLVASTGEFHFQLDNSTRNSAGLLGYYSPQHANARAGWTYGIPCRLVLQYLGVTYIKHRGKIRVIDPEPGQYLSRRVSVTSYDAIRDFAEVKVRDLTMVTGDISEVAAIQQVVAAMPATAQPVSTSYSTSLELFPFVFGDIGEGIFALALLNNLALTVRGYLYITGPGVFTYQSRAARSTTVSAVTLSDTMVGLEVPSSLEGVYNRIRVTNHPKRIGSATEVVWSQSSTTAVDPDATRVIGVTYIDPDDRSLSMGAVNGIQPVAYTDYAANEAADGSGTDRTGSVSVTVAYYGSNATVTIVSTTSAPTFLTTFQLRGIAVRDFAPETYEKYTAQSYGDRLFEFDMPYQEDFGQIRDAAEDIYLTYSTPASILSAVEFVGTTTLLVQALAREPGDRITISETLTGTTAVQVCIQSVALDIRPGPQFVCRWGVAPLAYTATHTWTLGDATMGLLGTTTQLGF